MGSLLQQNDKRNRTGKVMLDQGHGSRRGGWGGEGTDIDTTTTTTTQQPHRRCPGWRVILIRAMFREPDLLGPTEVLSTHSLVMGLGDDSALLVRGCGPISGVVLRTMMTMAHGWTRGPQRRLLGVLRCECMQPSSARGKRAKSRRGARSGRGGMGVGRGCVTPYWAW